MALTTHLPGIFAFYYQNDKHFFSRKPPGEPGVALELKFKKWTQSPCNQSVFLINS